MTKEQMEKHGEVILWFINNHDRGVWYKGNLTNRWFITHQPKFDVDRKYVKNDEYADFRMAMEEGKTIQYYVDGFIGWVDTTNFNNPVEGPENYRIKSTRAPKNYINYDKIEKLSNNSKEEDFNRKILKLSEKMGKLSQVSLNFTNISRETDKRFVLKESCEVLITVIDIINSLDTTSNEVENTIGKILDNYL